MNKYTVTFDLPKSKIMDSVVVKGVKGIDTVQVTNVAAVLLNALTIEILLENSQAKLEVISE